MRVVADTGGIVSAMNDQEFRAVLAISGRPALVLLPYDGTDRVT